MNRHIEKAYKAWRATVPDELPLALRWHAMNVVARTLPPPTPSEQPRKYAGTGRYKRTAAHKEASRKAALKRWAKARRRA